MKTNVSPCLLWNLVGYMHDITGGKPDLQSDVKASRQSKHNIKKDVIQWEDSTKSNTGWKYWSMFYILNFQLRSFLFTHLAYIGS